MIIIPVVIIDHHHHHYHHHQIPCNRNFWGQPSGWISWLFLPCTLNTYLEPIIPKIDTKSYPPIPTFMALYTQFLAFECIDFGFTNQISIFNPLSTLWYALFFFWATPRLDINSITRNVSSIGIGLTVPSLSCLCIINFYLFCS